MFEIKIKYDGKWGVNMVIEGDPGNGDTLLLTLATGISQVINKFVEPDSHKDAFNFVMKTMKKTLPANEKADES